MLGLGLGLGLRLGLGLGLELGLELGLILRVRILYLIRQETNAASWLTQQANSGCIDSMDQSTGG